MAFNGSGTFNRIYNWVNDKANGFKITASRMDGEFDGIATGLSQCITKDGQTTISANIPMANYKFTGLGNGSSRTDSIAWLHNFASLGKASPQVCEITSEIADESRHSTYVPQANDSRAAKPNVSIGPTAKKQLALAIKFASAALSVTKPRNSIGRFSVAACDSRLARNGPSPASTIWQFTSDAFNSLAISRRNSGSFSFENLVQARM